MIENLLVGFSLLTNILLVIVIVKLHMLPSAVGLAKTGASAIVSEMEAVIAKHKASPAATTTVSTTTTAAS